MRYFLKNKKWWAEISRAEALALTDTHRVRRQPNGVGYNYYLWR